MVQGANIDKNSEFKMQNAKLWGENCRFLVVVDIVDELSIDN